MHIDVYHDLACPWCRIGKRQLALALEQWSGPSISVRYRAFLLNPNLPPEGAEFQPYMLQKGGGRIPLEQFFAGPRAAGATVGLTFNFEQIATAPQTLLAHRMIALTPQAQQGALIDAIYSAYFEHGHDIGSLPALLTIAAEQGLDTLRLEQQLRADGGLEQVRAEVDHAYQLGISGVPFFVAAERYGLSGAQPPAVLRQLFERASSAA